MKTYKHLWEKLITKENFNIAYRNSIRKKKNQNQIRKFNENKDENLEAVRKLVISGNFHTSKYRKKKVYEPKERIIYKLPYSPDRIVQHAIMNILRPILTNLFIENSFACIEGRGQLKASQKCAEYVRRYRYCLKCDIHHFYPSINQHILSEKLHRIIKDDKFMKLVDDVIFSFPGDYNCPIGNYCSQWFGNYYLSFLDNYVLHVLKCGAYERYCDDFMLFSNDKLYLRECRDFIREFLWNELELTYSKDEIFDMKQGVDYVGYRHFKKYLLVRKSTGKRVKRRVKKIENKIDEKNLNLSKVEGQLSSAHGLLKHACTYNFKTSIHLDEMREKISEIKVNLII